MINYTKEGLVLLVILISCWLIAQTIKLFFQKMTFKDYLIGTGGMPSSHSACAISIPLFVLLNNGVNLLFVLSLAFAFVVIRDSFGVRFAVGQNADILQKLTPKKKVIKSYGHKFNEVLLGMIIGIITTTLFYIWLI